MMMHMRDPWDLRISIVTFMVDASWEWYSYLRLRLISMDRLNIPSVNIPVPWIPMG